MILSECFGLSGAESINASVWM